MKQEYLRAYQLMSELAVINQMPDTLAKATCWQKWNRKAIEWAALANPSCSRLSLVQSTSRPFQQNHVVTDPQALKI